MTNKYKFFPRGNHNVDFEESHHEHYGHPDFKCVVECKYFKTPEEALMEGSEYWLGSNEAGEDIHIPMNLEEIQNIFTQYHALISVDGNIIRTVYEYCSATFSLLTGKLISGSLWDKDNWILTEESLARCREYLR